jgi:5,6,7,8-tetrahydromethanopterin hydro-lyase
MSMFIGESLNGEGNEIAHIDLLIGCKNGPVGTAFANAIATQSAGHTSLLAVVAPNLICKPATVMITKVTIKGMKQAVQMFGPAQAAVARAVADSVAEGVITACKAVNLSVPLVVRMKGTNEDLGKKMLADSGLPIIAADTMAEAATKIVAAVK